MRKRTGLRGVLGAIAVTAALGATSPVVAQQGAGEEIDLAVICESILATTTRAEFNANIMATTALENEDDICHEIALAHWRRLQDDQVQTGAIDPYTFG